ncbi:MAG: hypothetical protein ACRDJW_03805 [Thermomicrobiales bacterium]
MKKSSKSTTALIDRETDARLSAEREQQRATDWSVIDRIRERNKDKDPDEVLADVTAVVEEVRQELYEREQQQAAHRR